MVTEDAETGEEFHREDFLNFQVAGLIQERTCTQPSCRISSAGNRGL
ncbi:hypothetical protein [uncultured Ilyobacter sp.]|nr:hypothetical protein [uncultured Ilyobacter sp.]